MRSRWRCSRSPPAGAAEILGHLIEAESRFARVILEHEEPAGILRVPACLLWRERKSEIGDVGLSDPRNRGIIRWPLGAGTWTVCAFGPAKAAGCAVIIVFG